MTNDDIITKVIFEELFDNKGILSFKTLYSHIKALEIECDENRLKSKLDELERNAIIKHETKIVGDTVIFQYVIDKTGVIIRDEYNKDYFDFLSSKRTEKTARKIKNKLSVFIIILSTASLFLSIISIIRQLSSIDSTDRKIDKLEKRIEQIEQKK